MNNFGDRVSFIWSVADLLRGLYKPAQYGRVILPLAALISTAVTGKIDVRAMA